MRVARYYNNRDVRLEEMPVPAIGPGELLVRVVASGICGSDVMEWYRIKKAPLVLGHEITGEIVETGEGAHGFRKGDRVFVSHHVPCNTCRYCLAGDSTVCDTLRTTNFDPGGFSEYLRVPRINVDRGVFVLPNEIDFLDGTFIEPLACALRGQRVAGIQPGNSVLVLGSGISGLLHLALARALGAGRILATDVHPYRIAAALSHGADRAFDARDDVPSRVREANEGRGADLVIVCTGAPKAFEQAMNSVDRGGAVLYFAPGRPGETVPLDAYSLWANGITLATSYGAAPKDIACAMDLIRFKRVEVSSMITHRLPLKDAGLGFALVAEAGESIKVIVEPQI